MKYIKYFESVNNQEFTGWIELAYYYVDHEIMVDVYSNGEIIDIYTSKKNNPIDFVKWIPGDNSIYVHCAREDYPEIVEYLLNGDDVQRSEDEEDEEDEDFYIELELRMKNRYEAEAEQMKNVKKYNL